MAVKLTFSLDDETVRHLRTTAERLRKPQSQVVREAVAEYAARAGRLSDAERAALLRAFDRLVPGLPSRPARAVDEEIRRVRAARRRGGRCHPDSRR
jgi:predicted transcriptional regulator